MKKKKIIIIVGLLVLVSILIPFGFSYARYATNSIWDYYLTSKGFYISSNELSDMNKVNVDNIWDGGSVSFGVGNYLNDSVITEYDINYEVSCEVVGNPNLECSINGSGLNKVSEILTSNSSCINNTGDGVDVSLFDQDTCEVSGYDYSITKVDNSLSFDVVSTDGSLVDVAEVLITLKSVEPYTKELTGTFLLSRNAINEGITANLEDNGNYYRLVVSNPYDRSSCVKVSFDSDKFRLDSDTTTFSNILVDSNDYIKSFTVNIEQYKSMDYIIYSTDNTKNYSITDFTVEESTGC